MTAEIACLADTVRVHGARQPDAAAIVYDGCTTSYGALDRASSQAANALIADGVSRRPRSPISTKSSDLFFELLFGAAKANAVMVSVNWRLAPPEVAQIVNDAEAEMLFVGADTFR